MKKDKILQPIMVDISKLISQSEYAKKNAMSRQLVYKKIKKGEINTVKIPGVLLVLLD